MDRKSSRIFPLLFMIFSLSFCSLAGCRDQPDSSPHFADGPTKNLRIGLIPEFDIFTQKRKYQPLADYLSRKTGADIKLLILPGYGNIINNFDEESLDGAFLGSFTGALVVARLGGEPLARPVYRDGTSSYHGLIFARKDSGIRNSTGMKGKRFAFVDQATTAGWLFPHYYLQRAGISDCTRWFSEKYFAGTHEDAVRDVLNREADIGAAKNTVFNELASKDDRILNELEILAKSPPVPANALIVGKGMDQGVKEKIKSALLAMNRDAEGEKILAEFGATRFTETKSSDYQPVFDLARELGIDLSSPSFKMDAEKLGGPAQ